MPSKLCRSSNKTHENLGLRTTHSKIKEREAPNRRTKDIEMMDHLRNTSLGRKKIRTPDRKIKISRIGATSIRTPGITQLIIAQSSH
jgi:hypothetical protein